METKKENSKNLPKNDDGTDLRRLPLLWFFQNKLSYFDLFYHFIMGKIGPKFSHLLTVSLTVKRPFFTTPLRLFPQKHKKKSHIINSTVSSHLPKGALCRLALPCSYGGELFFRCSLYVYNCEWIFWYLNSIRIVRIWSSKHY